MGPDVYTLAGLRPGRSMARPGCDTPRPEESYHNCLIVSAGFVRYLYQEKYHMNAITYTHKGSASC